jgi:hypothetical protein
MFDLYRAEDLINQQEILITLRQNKMNNEYIIVNKTAIQKRIEELENLLNIISKANDNEFKRTAKELFTGQIAELEKVSSQSTPLIPEIEKAFDKGRIKGVYAKVGFEFIDRKDYISNLKLDI